MKYGFWLLFGLFLYNPMITNSTLGASIFQAEAWGMDEQNSGDWEGDEESIFSGYLAYLENLFSNQMFMYPEKEVRIISFEGTADNDVKVWKVRVNGELKMYDEHHLTARNYDSAKLILTIAKNENLKNFTLIEDVKEMSDCNMLLVSSRYVERSKTGMIKTEQQVRRLKNELMQFLSKLHEAGFTHGDFTDSNILFEGQNPRVIDFEHAYQQKNSEDLEFKLRVMIDYADLVRALSGVLVDRAHLGDDFLKIEEKANECSDQIKVQLARLDEGNDVDISELEKLGELEMEFQTMIHFLNLY